MLRNREHLRELSSSSGIDEEDLLMIALNFQGVTASLPYPRMRFRLRIRTRPDDTFYTIVSLGKRSSPFLMDERQIVFDGTAVADVEALEDDDVVVSYFRKNGKVLTLNSNARSHCTGCVFCYNTLSMTSDPRIRVFDEISNYADLLMAEHGWGDVSHLEELTVCTGCFQNERPALDHLSVVREVFEERGFVGELGFLSSVIRSDSALERIQDALAPFRLTLTAECFSRRDVILKQSKASLTVDEMPELLHRARRYGLRTDFTYILGLDSYDDTIRGLESLLDEVTTCPRLQVYQAHNEYMTGFLHPEARDIEYFVRMRRDLEPMLRKRGLRPESWRNYRPLWYFSFDGEPLGGPRI